MQERKSRKEFKKPMADQAYSSWETIINESIVRAAVLVYMKENHFSQAEINNENERANFQELYMDTRLSKAFRGISSQQKTIS